MNAESVKVNSILTIVHPTSNSAIITAPKAKNWALDLSVMDGRAYRDNAVDDRVKMAAEFLDPST